MPALRPGAEPIRVLGYPIETVLAEKLVTAIDLAQANTRVRDFVDVYVLTGTHTFECSAIREAIKATAGFRGVELTSLEEATRGLGALRSMTYTAYRRGLGAAGSDLPTRFDDTISATAAFIDPVIAGMDDRAEWDPVERGWMS